MPEGWTYLEYSMPEYPNLEYRYIRVLDLPRVQVRQSAQSHQVHTIPNYHDIPYVVPTYVAPCGLVERADYALSSAWHAIAINT
jgi:hypothetical protein